MRASSACRHTAAGAAALLFLLATPFMSVGVAAPYVATSPGPASGVAAPVREAVVVSWFDVARWCFGPCPTATAGGNVVFLVTADSLFGGQPWTHYAGKVSFASTDPHAVLPASYTFTGSGAGKDNGKHLFMVTFKTAGPQKLKVYETASPTMTGTSDSVVIVAAPAHHTTFVIQPTGAMAGSPLSTQPTVEIRDEYGNHTSSTANVTLSLVPPAGSEGAALTCQSGTTMHAVAGTAAFFGCAVSLAGAGYTMVATSPGLLSGTSAPFTITAGPAPTPTATPTPTASPSPTPTPTPSPVGTLLLTAYSPYMNNNAIDWGRYVDLTTTAPAGTSFQIQVTTDRSNWTTLSDANATPLTFTIGASGAYTYRYTPIRNYWYRSVSGPTMTDGALRVTVRQTIAIRPRASGTVNVAAGTTITFSATVRPARPELQKANVVFQLYRRSGGSWVLSQTATHVIDGAGVARHAFTFSSGTWYVRAQAQPTPVNANSFWTPSQYYTAS